MVSRRKGDERDLTKGLGQARGETEYRHPIPQAFPHNLLSCGSITSRQKWLRVVAALPLSLLGLVLGGLVLWYPPGSLTRRKIWDTAGYKRVSLAFGGMCV